MKLKKFLCGLLCVCLLLGLESVFSVVGGALILGDRMTMREYLGCAVMFTAVVLAQLPGKRVESC